MTKSKLTHADKDIIITELETTISNMNTIFSEQVRNHTEFVLKNTLFVTQQHKVVEKLIKENNALKAVNLLVTAVLGIFIGVGSYLFFWR